MKDGDLLDLLVDLARKLDFEVRTDRGSFRDGTCHLQTKSVIVLNRASAPAKKVEVLSRALCNQPLDGLFLLPAVREVIEKARSPELKPFNGRQNG